MTSAKENFKIWFQKALSCPVIHIMTPVTHLGAHWSQNKNTSPCRLIQSLAMAWHEHFIPSAALQRLDAERLVGVFGLFGLFGDGDVGLEECSECSNKAWLQNRIPCSQLSLLKECQ